MKKLPASFTYTDILGGKTEGITRRDPSPVIRVGDLYYVWYSRTIVTHHGYTATIWYANSPDGYEWSEQKQALSRGPAGAFDEHAVFTPSIFIYEGKYYLSYTAVPEPFYNGAPGQPEITPSAIGLAKAYSPDGPWKRISTNPIFQVSQNHDDFDSLRVDDTCFIIRENKIWMYYKGRQYNHTPMETKMGLAIAKRPEGPYIRTTENPVVDGGHEVCVWPIQGGVTSLHSNIGPCGNTLQFSKDGQKFKKVSSITPPSAPGPYREDNYENNKEMTLNWGISMNYDSKWPWLSRFDVN